MGIRLIDLLNEPQWRTALADAFAHPSVRELERFLQTRLEAGATILPPQPQWFEALNHTPLDRVKVVILGQDPYPTPGHAHGLCFSVRPEVTPLPKSLVNIYKELYDDCGIDNTHTGFLLPWAQQGVLLLNTVLTVEAGNSGAHQKRGWEVLTNAIIDAINTRLEGVVFVLWGAHAQKKGAAIDRDRHHIIATPHPSPLSAYRGFFGSRPFSQINRHLEAQGKSPVRWQL
jgi:uracil-DNA glycosylase